MNAVAKLPLMSAPKTAASEIWLGLSSRPCGSSSGWPENSSMSFGEKPSARRAETACTVESAVRNSAVSNILVLPNSDHRKKPREKQVEHRHGHKRSCRNSDLDPSRRICAPHRSQPGPRERGHDDQKTLNPHADQHCHAAESDRFNG